MSTRFEVGYGRIQDLGITPGVDGKGGATVGAILIAGEPVKPSPRFWTSLHVRFGISANVFRYFSHAEVFRRISDVSANDRIRWTIERNEAGQGTLLAVVNPTAPLIRHADLLELLGRYDAEEVSYDKGVVRSRHAPRFSAPFAIGGDTFHNKYVLDTPIDGYGRPSIYLSLLRQVCSNGAIGYTPAFRSELALGRGEDGVRYSLTRALDGFNNEDGFGALRQRFEAATRSWASVREAHRLYRTLARLHNQGQVPGCLRAAGGDGAALSLLQHYHRVTGDLSELYGLANLDALSAKRQRTLPAACKVYDLLNLASELATHHAAAAGARSLQSFVGELVRGEYDLEGTAEHFSDFRDFFLSDRAANETAAALHCH